MLYESWRIAEKEKKEETEVDALRKSASSKSNKRIYSTIDGNRGHDYGWHWKDAAYLVRPCDQRMTENILLKRINEPYYGKKKDDQKKSGVKLFGMNQKNLDSRMIEDNDV